MMSKVLAVKSHFIENKNFYALLGKLLISAGLIFFIVTKVDFYQVGEGIKKANITLIVFCFLFMLLNVYLQYMKWKLACTNILNIHEEKKIVYSLFYGLAGGAFTPVRLGEYWGRSIALKEKPFLQVTAATIIDKLFPLIVVIIFGLIFSIPFMVILSNNQSAGYIYAAAIVLALLTLLLSAGLLKISREKVFLFLERFSLIKKNPDLPDIIKKLDKKFFLKMFLLSTAIYICFIFQYALLIAAFLHNMNLLKYMWAGILVMFTKAVLVPFSLTELGIREGASAYFMSFLGESSAAGFNAALFLFLINIIVPAIFGLILMLTRQNGK